MEWRRIERPLTIRFGEALLPKRLESLVEPRSREENKHVVKLTLKSFVLFGLSNGELSYSCHLQASRMALNKIIEHMVLTF